MGPLVVFHHELLAGKTGSWIVGISGILLLSNLTLGLITAWPRRGWWRASLKPSSKGRPQRGSIPGTARSAFGRSCRRW